MENNGQHFPIDKSQVQASDEWREILPGGTRQNYFKVSYKLLRSMRHKTNWLKGMYAPEMNPICLDYPLPKSYPCEEFYLDNKYFYSAIKKGNTERECVVGIDYTNEEICIVNHKDEYRIEKFYTYSQYEKKYLRSDYHTEILISKFPDNNWIIRKTLEHIQKSL